MKLKDFRIRDPFILPVPSLGKYYLYASYHSGEERGFMAYESTDLMEWSEPFPVFVNDGGFWATDDYWAPEVHYYRGSYYLFGSFSAKGCPRNSQILVSDSPKGPFRVHSAPLGPKDWFVLDATLYIEDGVPYTLFSHEWVQVGNGEICAARLSDDLTHTVGEPTVLFRAKDSGWSRSPVWNTGEREIFITDAPFVADLDGQKVILWSSWSDQTSASYAVGVAYPKAGVLGGVYTHEQVALPQKDCGHAMTFYDLNGQPRICFHEHNSEEGNERAVIYRIGTENGKVIVYA